MHSRALLSGALLYGTKVPFGHLRQLSLTNASVSEKKPPIRKCNQSESVF